MALYPVFGPAKANRFLDIQIPSRWEDAMVQDMEGMIFLPSPCNPRLIFSSRGLCTQTMPGVGSIMGG